MGWKAMDVQEQRVRFVVAASRREKPLGALCAEFGVSRPTGRLWIKRYAEAGLRGISERSRRPHRSLRDPAEPARAGGRAACALPGLGRTQAGRGARAQWGKADPEYDPPHPRALRSGARCGSASSGGEALRTRAPDELWQMDFKGPKNWPHAVGPLSVIDDHSRYLVALSATGKLDGELVRTQLKQAFERCGVPEAMLMDHGTPWWNWQSFSGRTRLSLWLMRQGIRLCWSGIRHPQTQGKVERFHGSLQRALDRRGPAGREPQAWLDSYRAEYNQLRPHEALGMQTPASRWTPSPRPYNPHPAPWQYPEGAWLLKVDCQGTVDIHGRRSRIGKTLAGEYVMIQPVEARFLVFYCSTLVREIEPAIERSTIVERWIETPQ